MLCFEPSKNVFIYINGIHRSNYCIEGDFSLWLLLLQQPWQLKWKGNRSNCATSYPSKSRIKRRVINRFLNASSAQACDQLYCFMFAHNCNSLHMYANVCVDYLCHLHSPVIVYAILQQHFRSLVWKALKMHSSNFDQLHKVTPLAGGVAQSALLVEHETPMARAPSHQTPWWANVDPGRAIWSFRAADMVTTFHENSCFKQILLWISFRLMK